MQGRAVWQCETSDILPCCLMHVHSTFNNVHLGVQGCLWPMLELNDY